MAGAPSSLVAHKTYNNDFLITANTSIRAKKEVMQQLQQMAAIEKRRWKAADTLRANSELASNEYFMPVMGLVFLRHVHSRYLTVKTDIEQTLPSRSGKVRALTDEFFTPISLVQMIVNVIEPGHGKILVA